MLEDSERLHDLAATLSSKGGKLIVAAYIQDIMNGIHRYSSGYATLSHSELIALGAEVSTKMQAVNSLYAAAQLEKEVDADIEEHLKR